MEDRYLAKKDDFTECIPNREPSGPALQWTGSSVSVLGAELADISQENLVTWLLEQARSQKQCIAYALHVGGLLELDKHPAFADVLNRSGVLYADGIAAVSLAKKRGAQTIERAATTDIGPLLLTRWAQNSPPARVGFIGGPPGLAQSAAENLRLAGLAQPVFVADGYQDNWDPVLSDLRESAPDIVFIGLGAPKEMLWCDQNTEALPQSLIITCGGWFGFVAGEEKRAPSWMQIVGAEWLWRLALSPRRLITRYSSGMWLMLRLMRPGRKH